MKNLKPYREHPSQIGKIMTNPRSKAEGELSVTARKRVQELYLRNKFGIKKEIKNKYLTKGIEQEAESIALFAKVSGMFGVVKNEERFENEFFVGTPDIITDEAIIDIKTSWDGNTYCWFDTELSNKEYEFQVLAYMYLTGRRKGYVAYCLTDASDTQIYDEMRRKKYELGLIDPTEEQLAALENELRLQMTYDRIPDRLRVKIFEVKYDEAKLEAIIDRVKVCAAEYERLDNLIEYVINK
jgi:hypothetical protein